MDLDEQVLAIIAANTREGIRINSYAPPDPHKEAILSLDNVNAQRAKINALLERMASRRPKSEEAKSD